MSHLNRLSCYIPSSCSLDSGPTFALLIALPSGVRNAGEASGLEHMFSIALPGGTKAVPKYSATMSIYAALGLKVKVGLIFGHSISRLVSNVTQTGIFWGVVSFSSHPMVLREFSDGAYKFTHRNLPSMVT